MTPHRLNCVRIELRADSPNLGRELIERISSMRTRRIAPTLDRVFCELSEPGRVDFIDTLEVDLGSVAVDRFEEDFERKLEGALRAALREQLSQAEPSQHPMSQALELVRLYARTGNVPWWADLGEDELIGTRLRSLAEQAPPALAALLRELSDDESALERLARHFDDDVVEMMLKHSDINALAPVLRRLPRLNAEQPEPLREGPAPSQDMVKTRRQSAIRALIAMLARRAGSPNPIHESLLADVSLRREAAETLRELVPESQRTVLDSLLAGASSEAGPPREPRSASPGAAPREVAPLEHAPAGAPPPHEDAQVLGEPLAESQRPVLDSPPASAPPEVEPPRALPSASPGATLREAAPPKHPLTVGSPRREVVQALRGRLPASVAPIPDASLAVTSPEADTQHVEHSAQDAYGRGPRVSAPQRSDDDDGNASATARGRLPEVLSAMDGPQHATDATQHATDATQHVEDKTPGEPSSHQHLPAAAVPHSEAPRPLDGPPAEAGRDSTVYGQATAVSPARAGAVAAARRRAFEDLEQLYVQDAGLVILWPFLDRFFQRVGLVDNDCCFIDEQAQMQAITLLEQLAFEVPEPPEYRLALAKLLCGMTPGAFFALVRPLEPAQLAEGNNLLRAVIGHASILRDMSPATFRVTFLQRSGVLTTHAGMWRLQVESKDYDVVLERFGWSWSWLKLPWMPDPLRIEW